MATEFFPPCSLPFATAKKTITFESYIYWSDAIGKEFADALAERARAGVKVHVLLDWVGSNKMDPTHLAAMEAAGVEVRKFHKPAWYSLARMNNRTHRKVLVVDGKVGFTGGVGIAGLWTGDAQDPQHWRDTHFRAEGPVVAQMQAVFLDNWIKATGVVLHGDNYFPELPASRQRRRPDVQQFALRRQREHASDVPAGDYVGATFDPLVECLFRSRQAKHQALVDALKRGVKVQIIVPGEHSDAAIVQSASRARWGDLLGRRRRDSRVPADDVSLQGVDHRQPDGVGRLDQFRHPLLSPQRRSQSEHLRSRFRSPASRSVQCRSVALTPGQPATSGSNARLPKSFWSMQRRSSAHSCRERPERRAKYRSDVRRHTDVSLTDF
jgi:phosphatidylserine/phosphatidylglycerophosphate/cardiolipin synthase-like enzyme